MQLQVRKRNSIITVSDEHGVQLQGANIKVEQISRDFPFGVAVSQSIINNPSYQVHLLSCKHAILF